jgi:hypothetical protein
MGVFASRRVVDTHTTLIAFEEEEKGGEETFSAFSIDFKSIPSTNPLEQVHSE